MSVASARPPRLNFFPHAAPRNSRDRPRLSAGELPTLGIGQGFASDGGVDITDYAGQLWQVLREYSEVQSPSAIRKSFAEPRKWSVNKGRSKPHSPEPRSLSRNHRVIECRKKSAGSGASDGGMWDQME